MLSARETLAFAHQLADSARSAILPYFRNAAQVENKSQTALFNPVTQADKAAETSMRALIARHRPDDAIIGEEFEDAAGTSGWTWVLDPIDGTSAFMAGTTTWGVLIGALHEGKPAIGIMDQPFTGERWASDATLAHWSRDGAPALALSTRTGVGLNDAMLATTDPYLFNAPERAIFERLQSASRLTRFGLDCTAYALLAQGHIDVVLESGLKIMDIAALIPIIEAAGGVVTDWEGNPNPLGGSVLAAGSPALHAEALALIRP
jgi:histidinol phosphatase-like enzyme (inositol monophosphatase family)